MGYTTYFDGLIAITPTMRPEHVKYIQQFSETRRMHRNEFKAAILPDPVRGAASLPVGRNGEFFVGGNRFAGQGSDESVVNYNCPPPGQPSLWCGWTVDDEGTSLMHDDGEKFYEYIQWMDYLMKNFFSPWGYRCNGTIDWSGEYSSDHGRIYVKDNAVEGYPAQVVYPKPSWEES